ncbi:MAG: hypothetical protein PHE61_03375 [Candidatus Omnitrophica bacterium]|nr:hypothetical protein [Candidatus Omnitrophota bacterium]
MVRKVTFAVIIVTFLLAAAVYSDEIYLKKGGSIEGEITERNDKAVTVKVEDGTIVLGLNEVDRIVPKEIKKKSDKAKKKPSRKIRINFVSVLQWFQGKACLIHQNIFRCFERWNWFNRICRNSGVIQFKSEHKFLFEFIVYFTVFSVIIVVCAVIRGVVRGILGIFFKRFRT